MKRLFVTGSVAVLLCVTACGPSQPNRTHSHTAAAASNRGLITGRAYSYLTNPAPYCRRTPTPPECASHWELAIVGYDHPLSVSKATYQRCHKGDYYPSCAGGR